jgi:osmotically-inducible protein OsmY
MIGKKPFALAIVLFAMIGCNRQDTECLTRIGRKVSAHTKASTSEMGKIDLSWVGMKREPSLQEKVQDRLRYENTLSDVKLEVTVKDKQVELKGTVKTPSQRQRAIELADTVGGVEKVSDAIVVREEDEAAR